MADLRASFRRAQEGQFAARFYEEFLAIDPAVRAKFAQTDFARQQDLLTHSVYSMLDYAEGKPIGRMALDRLVRLHGPGGLDIPAYMYGLWQQCFVSALWKADPEFHASLEKAWREALAPSLELMAAGSGTPVGR